MTKESPGMSKAVNLKTQLRLHTHTHTLSDYNSPARSIPTTWYVGSGESQIAESPITNLLLVV